MFLCTPEITVKREGQENRARPVRCKRWSCEHCKETNRRKVIALAVKGKPTAMLTLTVSNKNYPSPHDAANDLKRGLVALRKRIARKFHGRKMSFLAVFERHKSGWPHLHLLIRAPFMPHKWLVECWKQITASYIVDIRPIDGDNQARFYVAKYLGKDLAPFEHCKRWWRSHDFNDKEELTEEERQDRRLWMRMDAHWEHFLTALQEAVVDLDIAPNGTVSWHDPPSGPLSLNELRDSGFEHYRKDIIRRSRAELSGCSSSW